MMRAALPVVTLIALAACAPEPRSVSYFTGHQDEAARVSAACARGTTRGRECDNALAGLTAVRDAERLKLYRRSF